MIAPIAPLTDMLLSSLEVRAPLLSGEIAREIVDRHRGPGRWRPSFRHAVVAPVDDFADRFARAIAARHDAVLYLLPDGVAAVHAVIKHASSDRDERTFRSPWPNPSRSAIPFAVYLADGDGYRTLAIDVDAKRGDAGPITAAITDLFGGAAVRFVVCESRPEGGRHILATWQERIAPAAMWRVLRALKARFPSIDMTPMRNVSDGCIRPPLSRHYLWGRSRPVGDVHEALRVLEEGNPPEVWRSLASAIDISRVRGGRRRPGLPHTRLPGDGPKLPAPSPPFVQPSRGSRGKGRPVRAIGPCSWPTWGLPNGSAVRSTTQRSGTSRSSPGWRSRPSARRTSG